MALDDMTFANALDPLKSSFPPVVDPQTRLLILGSLPGEASLRAAQYYAHPQNQFWRLIGAVIGVELAGLAYPARLAALLSARVGLWDVVGQARRSGSLDTALRDVAPNALGGLIARLPALRAVAFNGAKAAAIGARLLEPTLTQIALPSSSPAYTAPFEHKAAAWLALRSHLQDAP